MSDRQLRYFIAVVEHHGFTAAADHLHIAQSALSRHVGELERRIGAQLIHRGIKGLALTHVGRVLYDEAREAISRQDRALARARRVAAGIGGVLSIGVNELALRHAPVVRGIAAFREVFPDVVVEAASMPSIDQLEALREGRIDAAFVVQRFSGVAGLHRQPLLHDRYVVAMPEGHRLARGETPSLADMAKEAFVMISPERHRVAQARLIAACNEAGFSPRAVATVDSDQAQMALVAQGIGIGFINQSARHHAPSGLCFRPVAGLATGLDLELIWFRDRTSALLTSFGACLARCLGHGGSDGDGAGPTSQASLSPP